MIRYQQPSGVFQALAYKYEFASQERFYFVANTYKPRCNQYVILRHLTKMAKIIGSWRLSISKQIGCPDCMLPFDPRIFLPDQKTEDCL